MSVWSKLRAAFHADSLTTYLHLRGFARSCSASLQFVDTPKKCRVRKQFCQVSLHAIHLTELYYTNLLTEINLTFMTFAYQYPCISRNFKTLSILNKVWIFAISIALKYFIEFFANYLSIFLAHFKHNFFLSLTVHLLPIQRDFYAFFKHQKLKFF